MKNNKELQSFYDGYSLHAYEIFGAHFTKKGVCFRLYAPNARSVRLIGDFNNWIRTGHFWRKLTMKSGKQLLKV